MSKDNKAKVVSAKLCSIYGTPNFGDGITMGIEYEIEAVQDHMSLQGPYGFMSETDHSLRNNGIEFKTAPISLEYALDSFNFLHKKLVLGNNPYSDRTSIHVHLNVGNLTEDQAKNFVLLYACLEPIFFKFAGESRQNNIFCVPLNYTTLPSLYNQPFQTLLNKWHKYTAFNILPAKNFGTFEFRHLGGTGDYQRFRKWLLSIASIFTTIESQPDFTMLEFLAKNGDVAQLAKETLPYLTDTLSLSTINTMLYDSILDVKLATGGF